MIHVKGGGRKVVGEWFHEKSAAEEILTYTSP